MKKVSTQMLIRKKSAGFLPRLGGMCLFLFISFLVHAQARAGAGSVKDEGGRPLQGAEVLVMSGSNVGTPDADGKHFECHTIIERELNQNLIL